MADHVEIRGWQVSEAEPDRGFGRDAHQYGGRLLLFRTETAWTLLRLRSFTRYDEHDRPIEGSASARAVTYGSLDELRTALDSDEEWRALVKAGASEPYYDPDLMALWAPVQIDRDLDGASVHLRELGVHGGGRQQPGWREEALALAVDKLEEVGFNVLASDLDHRQVFRRGLGGEWSNPVVGAVVAAKWGYRVQLVVAVDGFGEIYTRTVDTSSTPGTRRRYPPRPLTEREHQLVDEARRRRRVEQERNR